MTDLPLKNNSLPAPSAELEFLRAIKQAFDVSSIISITNTKGIITYANENFETISGYSSSELVGKPHNLVNSKVHPKEFWAEMWKTISSGQVWQGQICNRKKSGASYWVQSSILPMKDRDGTITGYVSIRHDITATKRLESDLRAGQRLQELIMETAPVGIFRTDSESNCNYVNSNWTEMTGLGFQESLSDGWILPIHSDDKYKVFGAWGDFVTGQTSFAMRWRFQRPDGSIRWVQGTAAAVRNDGGRIVSYLGAAVDITTLIDAQANLESKQVELVDANKNLQEQTRELERASKAKSIFLANMSHEIRTPLNGVLGMGQILAKFELPNEASEIVKDIINSGEMLMSIINDLLDFSKIDAGNMTIERRSFHLSEMISKTILLVSKAAKDKNLDIKIDLNENLPSHVLGDELRTRQILLNLLSNAIKFTKFGSVTIRAKWIIKDDNKGFVEFDVVDTGMGMSETQIQKLFNPFTQADESITRQFGGTGLGLSIAQRLAGLMGGNISVKSRLGEGSTFTFSILTQKDIGTKQAQVLDHLKAAEFKHLQILVAEDNLTNQKLIKLLFKKIGLDITIATNGREAVEIAAKQNWDVIFMDMQMPELSGIDATIAIRNSESPSKNTPILALTANAFDDDKASCFSAGMNAFISKPIRIADIEDALSSIVRGTISSVKKAG